MNWMLMGVLFAGVSMTAHAELFKCPNDKGKISYQDTPCVAGSTQGRLEVKAGPTGYAPDASLKERGQALDERMKKRAETPQPAVAAPPQQYVGPSNTERTAERKFLALTHSHIGEFPINESEVLAKVGEPDRREAPGGQCPQQLRPGNIRCQESTWIYEPNGMEPDTRTVVRFDSAGNVVKVDRQLVR